VNNGDGGGKCFFFSPGVESVLWRKNGKFKNCPISVFLMNGKKNREPDNLGFNYNDKSNNSKPVHAYTNPRDRMEKKNSECLVMRFCLPLGQPTKIN